MKPLVLTPEEWLAIRQEIDKNHPKSVTMVRWKMREVLGFTTREHTEWKPHRGADRVWREQITTIHLDFFDDRQRTMFLLKYGNGRD
jgi:hypothetical protein